MSTRLYVRLAIAGVALVVVLIVSLIHPTRVTFSPANLSIDPGKGWKTIKAPAAAPVCSPRLVSKSGMINAVLLDEDLPDAKAAAEKMQGRLAAAGRAAADGFKQEDFTTATGLAGVHFSYTAKSAKSDAPEVTSHHFIARNMRGRCVSISLITSPDVDSSATVAAITRTLRVE
jgi:hypothetical protein